MTYILTLVTAKHQMHSFLNHLPEVINNFAHHWLSSDESLDVYLPPSYRFEQAHSIFLSLKQQLSSFPIDLFLSYEPHRRKKLLIADMDSTIVTKETLDEFAYKVGLGEQIATITQQTMEGKIDFIQALEQRISLLKGISETFLEKTWQETHLSPGAKELMATMRTHGAYCSLCSGGFTYFTEKVANRCYFNEHQANQLIIEHGKLTGKVQYPIQDKQAKYIRLVTLREKLNLLPEETIAVGDGANDISMLNEAGIGIGYHPKMIVKQHVDNIIEHTSLKSILFLQGYHDHEITSDFATIN